MILVNSKLIIDVQTEAPFWQAWSEAAPSDAADRDEVVINPIVYAEIASGFTTISELDWRLGADVFRKLALPYEAGFVAGRAFVEHRRRGGPFGSRRSRLAVAGSGVARRTCNPTIRIPSRQIAGAPIGAYDVLIAACALRRGLKIVTHNAREFIRVGGLGREDWPGS
jgi:predicted nucleic acid-binding protein